MSTSPNSLPTAHEDFVFVDTSVSEEKTFNVCFTCPFRQRGCSGPNLCEAELDRLRELFQAARIERGHSYMKTAELTGFAVSNVKNFLDGTTKNPSFLLIQKLSHLYFGDPEGKRPCAVHRVLEMKNAETRRAEALQQQLEVAQLKIAALEKEKAEFSAKLEDMTQRKDHFKGLAEEFKNQVHQKDTQIGKKDEQLGHRAFAMQERWQIIERQMKEIDELKTANAKLLEKLMEKV